MKFYLRVLCLFIMTGVFFLSSCRDSREFKKVRMKLSQDKEFYNRNLKNSIIRIGIAPVISPKSSFLLYSNFIEYLRKKSGLNIEPVLRKTYIEINELLRNSQLDIAFICTGAYIHAKHRFPVKIFVLPVVNGKITYHSYVITYRDNPVSGLYDMRNKSFGFTDMLSLSGYFYIKHRLFGMKEEPAHFFSRTIWTGSHDNSIKLVAEKVIDAACVDSLVYEFLLKENNPYVRNVKVIEKSPEFGIPPVVIRTGLSAHIRRSMLNILMNMHENEEGRNVLKSIGIDKFVSPQDDIYSYSDKILIEMGEITPPPAQAAKPPLELWRHTAPRSGGGVE